jgi:hypothetical protein
MAWEYEPNEAERFYYDHSGYSCWPDEDAEHGRMRGAIELAEAGRVAAEKGWVIGVLPEPCPERSDGYSGPVWMVAVVEDSGEEAGDLEELDVMHQVEAWSEDDPEIRVIYANLVLGLLRSGK